MNSYKLKDKFAFYRVDPGKSEKPGTAVVKVANEKDSECIVQLFTPSGSFWSQMTLENLKNSNLYRLGKEI